ncbi:EAL domain-containing protein [Rhodoferax sp. GW822-FHT02A01]|uniref:EAL domain-containing protein n=1 Tax=Rhodoferax sp. GW822-FHT02A01 TaxID=3141537 RepID=UPI00315DDA66
MPVVLIVDDQTDNRDLVTTLVRYAGHTSLEAANGGAALELVRREKPDLVICDLLMPVMDGYEFVRQLRAHADIAHTRVVFYTATYLEEEARALAAACGVKYLLFKPCEPELILKTIELALQQQPSNAALPDEAGFDREHMRLLTDKLVLKVGELEAANQRLHMEVMERQRASERLQESELRFRQIADNIREVFFLTDPEESRYYYVSPAYAGIYGLSCESLYANPQSWLQVVHADDLERVVRKLAAGRADGTGYELEYRILWADGQQRHIHSSAFPIRNAAGAVYRFAGVAEDVTEQVRLRVELRARETDLRRAQSLAKLAHLVTRPDGSFESWSDSLPALLGVAPDQVESSSRAWLARVHPDDRARFRAVCIEAARTDAPATVDYRLQSGGEGWIHLHQELEPLHNGANTPGNRRWFSTLQDVTAQKLSEQKIHKLNRVYGMLSSINSLIVRATSREQLLRESCQVAVEKGQYQLAWIGSLGEGSSEGEVQAWCGDDGTYVRLIRLTTALDAPFSSRPASRALQSLKPIVSNDVRADPTLAELVDTMLARGLHSQACFPLVIGHQPVGVLTLCSAELNAFDAQEIQLLVELSGNISFALDHIQKGERLNYMAYFDALTGLPNSASLTERLEQGIAASAAQQRKLALVLMDVERFKAVNQAYGRQGGDALLRQLAQRLLACPDTRLQAARISADRFALLLQDMADVDEVARWMTQQYRDWFDTPFVIQGQVLHVSAKMGVAIYPTDGSDAETLYRNTEAVLKKAKSSNERVLFYDVRMAEAVSERLALEGKLRLALKRDEFVLHYQAKVDVDTRRLEGVEALIRWNSPELGLVQPSRFIPLLEESGLIVEVGLWALRRAAQDHARWRAQGLVAPRIAVNVSAVQLREADFVSRVTKLLGEQVAPQGIDIELTESLLMEDVESNIEKLNALRSYGVRLSIDDFGTGYSSMAYLSKLPAEILKIDRAFILTMLDDPDTMTLVSTMISMAHSLRMKVVAEGVETEEQAKILRLLRCDQMQGFLIGRPVPFEELRP